MTALRTARLVTLAAIGIGIVGIAVSERSPDSNFVPWLMIAVAGLSAYSILEARATSPDPGTRWARVRRWSPVLLGLVAMWAVMVAAYGFRTCDDLPAERQCVCRYVEVRKAAREAHGATIEQAAWLTACAADPALEEARASLKIP